MVKCYCDRCGKDITDRQEHLRLEFTYFGDNKHVEEDSMEYFDVCLDCFLDIKNFARGKI